MHPAVIIALTLAELKLLGPAISHYQAWVIPMLAVNYLLTFWITFGLCLIVGRFKRLEFLVV
jgi:hypothetical protein